MKNKLNFLILFFISANALAAGSGGITDLIAPAVNFAIFFTILFLALKNKLVDHFNNLSTEVKSMMESAEAKNKDAEARLKASEQKVKNLEAEMAQIKNEYAQDFAKFEKTTKEEMETTVSRLQRDVQNKLESERNVLIEELNKELVDSVITKTKNTLATNSEAKKQATQKLIAEIR